MEYYRNNLLANIACRTAASYSAKWYSTKMPVNSFGAGWSKLFYIRRMNWDENAISLFVDNRLLNRVELKKLVNHDGSAFNTFKQPHYILLTLALGGNNGGDASATALPLRYEID